MKDKKVEFSEKEQKLLKEWVVGQELAKVGNTVIVCLTIDGGREFTETYTTHNNERVDSCYRKATKKALSKLDDFLYAREMKQRVWF